MIPRKIHISLSALEKSPKKEGKLERDIIPKVAKFFRERRYETKEHVSMNLAWGRVLSEIDLIATKEEKIAVVEVKSKRDKVIRARRQLDKMRSLADYCFIASETIVRESCFSDDTGILLVGDDRIWLIRDARKLNEPVTKGTLLSLKKECLMELSGEAGLCRRMSKDSMADFLLDNVSARDLKRKVKGVVFCSD